MAVSTYQARSKTLGRILSLLESLKNTAAGSTLYLHIEKSLLDLENAHAQSEKLYLNLLNSLLGNLSNHFTAGTEQRMQVRIMQKSLQESMSEYELNNIQVQIQQLINQTESNQSQRGQKNIQDAFDSLLYDLHEGASAVAKTLPRHQTETSLAELSENTTPQKYFEAPPPFATFNPEAPFCHIDKTRSNIQTIQSNLSDQIDNAKQFNSALAKLLHSSFAAIRNLDDADDLALVKNNFLRRYAKLIKMQQDLATKFQSIDESLHDIESDRHNLDEELSRVHRLSLTDELTQLPNRRAFLMRLDDEISRALRFNYPLAMALIDIDNFKPINDTFGHAAGDLILRHFSQNMNVVFRYHDMASRYGGEEFAVLFPNTNITGAMSALNKLQYKLKIDPYIQFKNDEVPVPTFSAGIALYNPGEDADELIKRADVAMYKAKKSGRDQIQLDNQGIKQKKKPKDESDEIDVSA